ncbi:hypothetical protein WAF17_21570 [Bernardetia sp. ABR2-2B]|uniref:hypothetical protein n=1 Tax=Bernardetia sp. ABR2-2B TaxID=3127472 RepID=UPI0030D5F5AD
MPQNPPSNRLSSLVGFILLFGIIGFTVYINTVGKKKEIKVIPEKYLTHFDSIDVVNLWKLEKFQTGYPNLKISDVGSSTDIEITKIINEYTTKESAPNYGTLLFINGKNIEGTTNKKFIDFFATSTDKYSFELNNVGNLFLQYQINSITSEPENGNFTCIEFKNDVQLFLIKENIEIKSHYYRSLLRESEYINDSTALFLPSNFVENNTKSTIE